MIKRAIGAALATVLLASSAQAAVCLQNYQIRETSVKDARTILFHMQDGSVWRNTLRNEMPGPQMVRLRLSPRRARTRSARACNPIQILRTHEVLPARRIHAREAGAAAQLRVSLRNGHQKGPERSGPFSFVLRKQKGPGFLPGLSAFLLNAGLKSPYRPCRRPAFRPAFRPIPSSDDRRPSPPS